MSTGPLPLPPPPVTESLQVARARIVSFAKYRCGTCSGAGYFTVNGNQRICGCALRRFARALKTDPALRAAVFQESKNAP